MTLSHYAIAALVLISVSLGFYGGRKTLPVNATCAFNLPDILEDK